MSRDLRSEGGGAGSCSQPLDPPEGPHSSSCLSLPGARFKSGFARFERAGSLRARPLPSSRALGAPLERGAAGRGRSAGSPWVRLRA